MVLAYRLSPSALSTAIKHLVRYGDTDVLPHLPELAFYADEEDTIIDELSRLDLDTHNPRGANEVLAPKGKFSFRVVHQLPALDNVLLLACVIEIGGQIERRRPIASDNTAFSYRFSLGERGQIFEEGRSYRDWLNSQETRLQSDKSITHVVSTDISDFYSRINYHRLENLLADCAPGHGAVRFINKHVKVIRASQSFGLPIGGSAARLLAELALSDTDAALQNHGLYVTRFVDDFRFFLHSDQNAYDALALLAEQVGINEGLALNAAKTVVFSREEYLEDLGVSLNEVEDKAQAAALEIITASLYTDTDPDPSDVDKLRNMNLLLFLEEELAKSSWDVGKVKVIFRALRIVKPLEAVDFIKENFSNLGVFAKEVCLLMQTLDLECTFNLRPINPFQDMERVIVDQILHPPASSVQAIRSWLLEIFVRGLVTLTPHEFARLRGLSTPLDKGQLALISAIREDVNFFRRRKTAIGSIAPFEQSCTVLGASCLPKDEYETWTSNVKSILSRPLDHELLRWAKTHRKTILSKVRRDVQEHDQQ